MSNVLAASANKPGLISESYCRHVSKIPRVSAADIEQTYLEIKRAHSRFLRSKGVSLPTLRGGMGFTQSAVALVGLYLKMGQPVTKSELTRFVRTFVAGADDLQEGRHLGSQRGWYVVSSTRKDPGTEGWPRDSYCLISISETLPDWVDPKLKSQDWETRDRKPWALLNPDLILRSPESVQLKVLEILQRKFRSTKRR